METILQVEKLTKSFGGIKALDGVDLSVAKGELRCLIGQNGAGKSTLFSLLAGLQPPDGGRLIFNAQDITKLQPYQRVRNGIGLKFQTTRIYRGLTVEQNLAIARGASESKGHALLIYASEFFEFDRCRSLRGGELPHGRQQWLEICMALATEPELLLLDEPTSGMSPEETNQTAEFVNRLSARRVTVIVVEHDMNFVRQIARTITVLHYGRVFAEGRLADIESNPDVKRIYLGEQ
jgi:branched-chain amino acid transport system ATP-binding protein